MTIDEAFELVAKTANCSDNVEQIKSVRPKRHELQYALESMVTYGIRLDIARDALWLIEDWFDQNEKESK